MPIPGLKASYEVRAKVRVGEKREGQRGSFPVAVDYFVSDDAEFVELCGDKPKAIRITFAHADIDDVFPTGMEWWMGKLMACYSEGDGTALRKAEVEQGGQKRSLLGNVTVLDQKPIGNDRRRIECKFRDCPDFGSNAQNKKCRVMGRLRFFLDGGRTDQVLEFGTKSWNSIEELTGALTSARAAGPLTGRVFELSVEFRRKGTDRFPVVSLKEANVPINTEADVTLADLLIEIEQAVDGQDNRPLLCRVLDAFTPGWRDDERYINRVKEVGAYAALQGLKPKIIEALS